MNETNQKISGLVGGRYLYLSDYNQVLNAGIKDFFLEHGDKRKITAQDVDIDEEAIRKRISNLPHMTFELTENCNLRCKYCVFNGHYQHERELSPRNMDFETARKGIDYIFSFVKQQKKKIFTMGFYGGEPLLNIETMEKIIAYGKKKFDGWKLRFNMTTNLTLLDDHMLDLLIENDISLLVSLDGGKENHDAKRVFANGEGTFDTVMKNLERIAARDRDYFDRKIGFSSVYSPDLPLKNLADFFKSNDLAKHKRLQLSQVKFFDTSYYEKYPYDKNRYYREQNDMFALVLEKTRQGEELCNYEKFLFKDLKFIGDSIEKRAISAMAGTCDFGARLYFDARGRFHICERVNNTFPIGDVEKGFYFEKMIAIVKEFCAVIEEHCSDCNIQFLCSRCYVQFAGNGEFRLDPEFCKQKKETAMNNLETFIRCKEEGLV